MNFFLISNMYPDDKNSGYGSFVKNVTDALAKHGLICKYSALIVGRPSSIKEKCLKYIAFYYKIISQYFKNYDFIYVHYPNHSLPVLLPCYYIKRKKVIINLHGEDLLYSNKGLSNFLGRLNDFFMTKANGIVVPSEYYKDIVLQRVKCDPNKVIVSPSGGIDPQAFYPNDNIDISEDGTIRIGYVGRIDKNKGWKQFIEAIKLLPESVRYNATIIGSGAEINQLKEEIKDLPSGSITYIPNVAQKSLREYYTQFDLLVFPTMRKTESLGLVGIEAMACGIPVLGSRIGGVPSYLIDGYNGFLVEPGNVKEVSQAIIKFSQLDTLARIKMCESCLTTSKKYFSDFVVEELANAIRSI